MHGFNDPVLSLLPGQASNCPPINTHSDSHPFHPPQPCRLHHTHTHTHANTPASRHLLPAVPPQCKSAALRATSSQLLKYIVCVVLLGIIQIFFFFLFFFTTSTPYRGGCSSAALRHTESFFFLSTLNFCSFLCHFFILTIHVFSFLLLYVTFVMF